MQAQAHIPGQVSGEAGEQLPGLTQQNGSSLPSQASNVGGLRRPWHADSDLIEGRQSICNKIFKLLQVWQLRKPQPDPQSQHRMPEFARRLEECLFNDAASKDLVKYNSSLQSSTEDSSQSDKCAIVESAIVSSIEENMTCSICLNIWHDVVSVTPCLHNFCNACFSQLYKRAGEKGIKLICPQCRSDIYSVGRNHSLQNIVEDLLKYNSLLQSSTEDSSQLDKCAIVQSDIMIIGKPGAQRSAFAESSGSNDREFE